jgi:hypothetical protein
LSDYFHLEAGRSFCRLYSWRCLFRQTWIFDTNHPPATWVGCHVGLVAMMVAEVDEAKQIRNVVSR